MNSVSEYSNGVDCWGPTPIKTYLHVANKEHIRRDQVPPSLMETNHDTGHSAGDKDLRSHLVSAAV